jgi:hypothetical protein
MSFLFRIAVAEHEVKLRDHFQWGLGIIWGMEWRLSPRAVRPVAGDSDVGASPF